MFLQKINLLFFFIFFSFGLFGKEVQTDLKLLITGCGKSGTAFTAKLLQKNGLDIHHEAPGKDGCVSWPMVVNYYSPWSPITEPVEFTHIFHQVRHPLHVISSFYINLRELERHEWMFIRAHVPEIKSTDSLIEQCAKYWYYWNLKAELIAQWRYRVEDFEEILSEFGLRINFPLDKAILKDMPKNINSSQRINAKLTWKNLEENIPRSLYLKIKQMASKYGYSTKDE